MTIDGMDLSGIIMRKEKPSDRYILSRQGQQPLDSCNGSVRNDQYRLVLTRKDTSLFDLVKDPSQKQDIYGANKKAALSLLSVYKKWENELTDNYRPVTTIDAGFVGEKKITLPVQDATLSGKIKYSSIHPNQSYTENWQQNGDSVFWKLSINNPGTYRVELEYGCPASETGSKMVFYSRSDSFPFTIDKSFESEVLPERDHVKRSESCERTWNWMVVGNVDLKSGSEQLVIKLLKKKEKEAGLIKAIRLVKL